MAHAFDWEQDGYTWKTGDYNGDGVEDLIIVQDALMVPIITDLTVIIPAEQEQYVFIRQANGSYTQQIVTKADIESHNLSDLEASRITQVDYDLDGIVDVVITANDGTEHAALFSGTSSGDMVASARNITEAWQHPDILVGKMAGEFNVSQMGAATYSIPIALPPGPDGLSANISINYSSMGGQGILGRGWSLSAGGKIMPCAKTIAQDGAASALLRTSFWEGEYCWNGERLRPRNPGDKLSSGEPFYTESESFVDIHSNTGSVRTGFLAKHTDGTVQYFTEKSGEAFSLEKQQDTFGNTIYYTYEQDDFAQGGMPFPRIKEISALNSDNNVVFYRVKFFYEERRDKNITYPLPGSKQELNHRLEKITVSSGTKTLYEYHLNYDEMGTTRWESYLKSIQRCFPNERMPDGSTKDQCLKATEFNYEPASGDRFVFSDPHSTDQSIDAASQSMYRSEYEAAKRSTLSGDFNADGRSDYISFASPNVYVIWLAKGDGTFERHTRERSAIGYPHSFDRPNYESMNYIYLPGDHDGDGDTDLVHLINDHFLVVWLSNGDGTFTIKNRFPAGDNWEINNGGNSQPKSSHFRYQIGEFNGDGRVDLVHWRQEGARVWLSDGDGTFTIKTHYKPGGYGDIGANNTNFKIADINGDGLSDLMHVFSSSDIRVWINNGDGSSFTVQNNVLNSYHLGDSEQYNLRLGDFNGDGKIDLFQVRTNTQANIWLGKGDGSFKYSTIADPYRSGFDNHGKLYTAADVNGDGRTDLINTYQGRLSFWIATPEGSLVYTATMETGLTSTDLPPNIGNVGDLLLDTPAALQTGDINADGKSDITLFAHHPVVAPIRSGKSYTYRYSVTDIKARSFLNQTLKPASLRSIVDAYGNTTVIKYANLAHSNYSRSGPLSPASYPDQTLNNPVFYAVSEVKASDGVGSYGVSKYEYSDLRVNLQGLGMLGFGRVDQYAGAGWTSGFDPISDGEFTHTETHYNQNSTNRNYGSPSKVKQYHKRRSGGALTHSQLLSEITYTHEDVFAGNSTRFFHYVKKQEAYSWDLNGTPTTKIITDNWVDSYGNTTKSTTTIDDLQAGMRHRTTTEHRYASAYNYECYDRPSLARMPYEVFVEKQTYHQTPPYQPQTEKRHTVHIYDNKCRIYMTQVEPNNTDLAMTTEFTYDGALVETKTVSGVNFSTFTAETNYFDSRDRLLWTENAQGHRTTYSYDDEKIYWQPTTITDPNGLKSPKSYDALGRVIRETAADGTVQQIIYGRCDEPRAEGVDHGHCNQDSGVKYYVLSRGTAAGTDVAYHDSLDRQVRTTSEIFSAGSVKKVEQFFSFNADGEAYKASKPRFYKANNISWEITEYDFNHRPTSVQHFDGTTSSYSYNGLEVTVTNGKNQTTKTRELAWGGKLWTEDANGSRVNFTYDAFGNLVQTRDPSGNLIRNKYDIRGRKVLMDDPDLGAWVYSYDGLGRLRQQTDANGITTVMDYDELGRMTSRTGGNGVNSWWLYDKEEDSGQRSLGKLSRESNGDITNVYHYDHLGRPDQVTTHVASGVGSGSYTSTLAYDQFSRVTRKTYPNDGLVLNYEYDARTSELVRTSDATNGKQYWALEERNALGKTTRQRLGSNIVNRFTYDSNSDRLTHVEGIVAGTTQHNFEHDHDVLGNVTMRKDHFQGLHEDLTYDHLNRVKTVKTHTPWGSPTTSMKYDALGNITYKSDVGSYHYAQNNCGIYAGPHAVTETYNGPYLATYCYDSNGNMTRKEVSGGHRIDYTYTRFNKPSSMVSTDGTIMDFEYGPNRNRFRQTRTTSNGDIQTTLYLSDYERIENNSSLVHKYYVGGYGVVTKESGKADKINYLLKDPLGSVTTVLDAAGNVVERMSFDIWGKRRKGNWSAVTSNSEYWYTGVTTRGFTGHEMLDAVGLVYMNGRVYDPTIARFLSADPHIQAPTLLASYNRYSYAMNNPLYFTDPSGYFWKDLRKALITVAAFYVGCPQCASALLAGNVAVVTTTQFAVGMTLATTAHTYRHAKDKGASTSSAVGMAVRAGATSMFTHAVGGGLASSLPDNIFVYAFSQGALNAVAAGMNGGNPADAFKSGIISAGLGKALTGATKGWNPGAQTIASGVIAGVIADHTGGDPFLAASIAMLHTAAEVGQGEEFSVHGSDDLVAMSSSELDSNPFSCSMIQTESPCITGYGPGITARSKAAAKYGRVQTRINLEKGGVKHMLDRHLNPARSKNKSQFTLSESRVRALITDKATVRTAVRKLDTGNFSRTVTAQHPVGNLSQNLGGKQTHTFTVITDPKGNLVSAFPGTLK